MKRIVLALTAVIAFLALSHGARAAGLLPRLDPRLAAALVPGAEPVPVWVEFADKGERGPAELAAALAAAERDLTPACRARRVRAGVSPLVDFLDLPVPARHLTALEAQGLHPYAVSRWLNGAAVRASGGQLARLAALDIVRRVSPAELAAPRPRRPAPAGERTVLPRSAVPARAFGGGVPPEGYGMTAGELARLNVTALHDSGFVGTGVLICMFDEGFNFYAKHSATRNLDVGDRTRDFVRGGADVQDTVSAPWYYQHGQWTLSAVGGNLPGVFVGPAYGARFALARTEDSGSEKPVEMVNWLLASEWADSLGADIISSSLGYLAFPDSAGTSLSYAQLDGHTSIVTRAAEIAAAKGILVVNSAGNSGYSAAPRTLDAPADACGDSMLAVGAVDSTGLRANFSSNGPTADGRIKPDLMAEGVSVLLASASGAPDVYLNLSGTSFSCPLTAGVAACLIQARPAWSLTRLVRAMKYSASRANNPGNYYGWGLVNGLAALNFDTAGVPAGRALLRFAREGANPVRLGREAASFRFGLAAGAEASEYAVRVYDVTGRLVRTLWSGWLNPDGVSRRVSWDGAGDSGRLSRPGLYLLSFEAGRQRTTLRLVAIR